MTTHSRPVIDLNAQFGGHMGAVMHGLIYHLRRGGYCTSDVGHYTQDIKIGRYMNVARDPLTLSSDPSTIVLRMQGADVSALIEIVVHGPMIAGYESVLWQMALLKREPIFAVLHGLLPYKFLPKLLEVLHRVSAPMSPKHWVPYMHRPKRA